MTSVSKNVYIVKLDDIDNKYNNITQLNQTCCVHTKSGNEQ